LVLAHVGFFSFLWAGEGENPGKLLDGNKYTNGFQRYPNKVRATERGISWKNPGWKTGTPTESWRFSDWGKVISAHVRQGIRVRRSYSLKAKLSEKYISETGAPYRESHSGSG
jgi:hypothetical protein